VTLEGTYVRLEPLSEERHPAGLCEIGPDPDLWHLVPYRITTCDEMMAYVRQALAAQAAGSALPFAQIDKATGAVVGSTLHEYRYREPPGGDRVHVDRAAVAAHRHQRGGEVPAAPPRLETLGSIRVELKTDALNRRSRNAILRIGATQEGTLRQHIVTWTGRLRDTVYFSILDSEWPDVKTRLEKKLKPRA
jgi:RimJ/RimL family protein N-acetyltransferase